LPGHDERRGRDQDEADRDAHADLRERLPEDGGDVEAVGERPPPRTSFITRELPRMNTPSLAAAAGTARCPVADFVDPGSVVRRIWGDGDMVLLVFAGSAAEFALNRAVDWLFFTGKLPGDLMPPKYLPAVRGLDHPAASPTEPRGSPARDAPTAGLLRQEST
jgi:hypothetical protein